MAQRLVRTICPECKVEYEPDPPTCRPISRATAGPVRAVEGRGLPVLPQHSGFRGRTGIYELMVTGDDDPRNVRAARQRLAIRNQAIKEGMITLRFRDKRVWRVEDGQWVKDNIWGGSSAYGPVRG